MASKLEKRAAMDMIKTYYTDEIVKVIIFDIMSCIDEIRLSVKAVGHMSVASILDPAFRDDYTRKICASPTGINLLKYHIGKLKLSRDDKLADILRKYDIAVFSESTLYHDKMCRIFDYHLSELEKYVENSDIAGFLSKHRRVIKE